MLTYIKKIYRFFLPKKESDLFREELNNLKGVLKVSFSNNMFELKMDSGIIICLRDQTHSDLDVFRQIFIKEEYKSMLNLLKLNNFHQDRISIVDAGANIGLTTLYFGLHFDNAFYLRYRTISS